MKNNLLDQHFEEAIKDLPQKKLSFFANLRIRHALRRRAREMERRSGWSLFIPRLAVATLCFVFFFSATGTYAFYSPSVVKGDLLYPMKTFGEKILYPRSSDPKARISYHLWLNQRRLKELEQASSQEIRELTAHEASRNVELAMLIADEIKEKQKGDEVRNEILVTLRGHQTFYERHAPNLIAHQQNLLQRLTRGNFPDPEDLLVERKPKENPIIAKALKVHYQEQKKILKEEVKTLDTILKDFQRQPRQKKTQQVLELVIPAESETVDVKEAEIPMELKAESEAKIEAPEPTGSILPPEAAAPISEQKKDECEKKAEKQCKGTSEPQCVQKIVDECRQEKGKKEKEDKEYEKTSQEFFIKKEKLEKIEKKLDELLE